MCMSADAWIDMQARTLEAAVNAVEARGAGNGLAEARAARLWRQLRVEELHVLRTANLMTESQPSSRAHLPY